MVYPNYFATMGLPLRAGRDFSTADLAPGAPLVGVVNEAFVRTIMRGRNPIGQRIVVGRSGHDTREIIGIVKDTRYANLRSETTPLLYQPFLQTPTGRGQMTLHVRVDPSSVGVAARVREEVQRTDPNIPVPAILPLSAHLDSLLSRERMVATLSTVFGVLAMLLASIGLYGLMTFSVERRTNELGLRLALGADRLTVLRMILREALGLVGVGIALGITAAAIGGRWLASQVNGLLYGVTTSDPALLVVAAVTLTLVGAAAAYLPAARAARVDPMVALRNE
jgi:hypothetical protein